MGRVASEDSAAGGLFTPFVADVSEVAKPTRFTFPFAYTPHPLAIIAAGELQAHIESQTEWTYQFGWNDPESFGKMFGVLVVESVEKGIGYLSAFSGKLAGSTRLSRFVPPVYDALQDEGFYRSAEAEIEVLSEEISARTDDPRFRHRRDLHVSSSAQSERDISELINSAAQAKQARDQQRARAKVELSEEEFATAASQLDTQSIEWSYRLKDLRRHWRRQLDAQQLDLAEHQGAIDELLRKRKSLSAGLQQRLFSQYKFLNAEGVTRDLAELLSFDATELPPSGAGECAAPKLLQYAFQHSLRPLCMAEFWWGAPPASEVRKHGLFYPACRLKCEPILNHMLTGTPRDADPIKSQLASRRGRGLNVIFEDEHLAVIDKPPNLLSTPGKAIVDSVYVRALSRFPDATGPILVHRLDLSTSGLMVIAKSKRVHGHLQNQFAQRVIEKQYVALLDGVPEAVADGVTEGSIDLPLRVDLDARPRQLVCHRLGKSALTHWKVIEADTKLARIRLFPVTGRTHQLRVHAAHHHGLGVAIVGDDLYGTQADRLHLHAAQLQLTHPITEESLVFRSAPSF